MGWGASTTTGTGVQWSPIIWKRCSSGAFHLNLRGRGNDCRSRAEARGSSRKVPVRRRYTDFASSRSSCEALSPPGTEDSREDREGWRNNPTGVKASRESARGDGRPHEILDEMVQ